MNIAIASGKGGAGKTSVAASLARVWGGPLAAVDTDAEAPNLHLFLKPQLSESQPCHLTVPALDPALCTACDQCRDICGFKAIASFAGRISIFPDMCHGCGGCFAVCPTGALSPGQRLLGTLESGWALGGAEHGVRFLMGRTRIGESMTPPLLRQEHARLRELLAEMKKEMNLLELPDALLDSPPGVSCPAVTVTREADAILLVADPTPFGFHDFKLAHQAFQPLGRPIFAVMNRAGAEGNAEGDEAVRAYCRAHALPLLAELPFERAAAEQYAAGLLLADLSPAWRERFVRLRDALRAACAEALQTQPLIKVKEAAHA
ncbi:4Fe-4S binding protein [Mailhella sp.]|uniref:4Fe-4S binding protein n=1 Tax=Mailhella sp. TaxID=1981029 RepID=UPI004063765D